MPLPINDISKIGEFSNLIKDWMLVIISNNCFTGEFKNKLVVGSFEHQIILLNLKIGNGASLVYSESWIKYLSIHCWNNDMDIMTLKKIIISLINIYYLKTKYHTINTKWNHNILIKVINKKVIHKNTRNNSLKNA